jgi:flagellar biosynthesis/type III secretory pathway protein FliH
VKPRVIKAGSPLRVKPVEAPVEDARKAAARIVAEAQADAARLRAQAVADGHEEGVAQAAELLASVRAESERARREAETELKRLAVSIAEKILGRELALSPDAVIDVTREALRAAGDPDQLIVRAHPDDVAALEREKPRLMERMRESAAVTVRADAQVTRGGCVLETPLGVVDARLQTQLAAIERALAKETP